MFDGILLVDKQKNWTSHDVVAKVRGMLKKEAGHKVKVGHTGTLDPLATGLMIVVVGSYCKRAQEFSKLDKVYDVTMKLGITSTTGDEEGDKTTVSSEVPEKPQVTEVINSFVGEIEQTPPAYSAVKLGGKKAYELARAGKAVKLEPRKVTIHQLSSINYDYPRVDFTAHVSSGTYIRSLVEDIGDRLGTGAYMTGLRRARVGDFAIEDAISVEAMEGKSVSSLLRIVS